RTSRSRGRGSRDALLRQRLLQDTASTMKARHDGADRNVENLGRVGVTEVPEVDQNDDIAKVVRERRECVHDASLREPLDHTLLVERLLALDRGELVREEVV